jgi:hypothetical protein
VIGRVPARAEPGTWPVKSGMPVGGEDARWAQRDGPHVGALGWRGGQDGPAPAEVPEMAATEAAEQPALPDGGWPVAS